ncbi:hypothetical protein [Paenibacillus prosopidis]|uniref:Uncharacterized protein n=1 Tax=Paenibacillus prosopidis TaxID=630520 RepID=A0A368W0Y8_9BACL|nr:hypothetical protein [Paenibacillus prosopidis]RCW47413.1 hypothetical protein DFP97_10827 [Paenibacillus prosopidis]
MRRYWLSIIIAVLAVSGIGSYYAFARQNYLPEYKLETIQGDPKEGEDVTLIGSYYGDMRSEPLEVNTAGSEYGGLNTNFRTRLTGVPWIYRQPDIHQLIKDHKSFMRGKGNMNGFYRDEEWVIYSDVSIKNKRSDTPLAALKLTLLHEATDKVSTFQQTYELPKEPSHIFVEDVQRIDDEIFILVKKIYNVYKPIDVEYNIVVLDLSSGKQLRNVKLENWSSPAKDIEMQVSTILTDRPSAPTETFLFNVSEMKINKNTGNAQRIGEKYYSYSYRTSLLTELSDMGWQSADDGGRVISLQHDYFYFAEYGLDHITLSRYGLKTKEQERAYASISAEQLGVDEIKSVQISSNRVYLLFNQAGVPGAAVLDLTNGEVLFTGRTAEIGDEQETEQEMKENLHLLNLEIVEKIKD